MGTALLANSTIKLSFGWNAFYFWGVWALCIIGIGIVLWAALRSKLWDRWTTQDILIIAAMGVLLEVYDNIIGDQFIKPLVDVIPGADLLQVHDLPYMFLLMVGVALVRKPGCVTAMVFVNYLLAQLLFGSGHGALDWTDGLTQGIFCDLYIVARRGKLYAPGSSVSFDGDRRADDRHTARRPEPIPDRLDVRSVPELDLLHLVPDVDRHLVERHRQRRRGRDQRGAGDACCPRGGAVAWRPAGEGR